MRSRRDVFLVALAFALSSFGWALAACDSSDSATPLDAGSAPDAPNDGALADVDQPMDSAVDSSTDAPAPAQRCVLTDAGERDASADPPCNGVVRTVDARPYCVHAPSGGTTPAPLVLLLHGYRSSGQEQANYFGLDAMADAHGFVLVKPDGVTNGLGERYWNAFPSCCAPANGTPPDDVAFLTKVVDDVKSAFSIDAKRVFVVGHSNGGFMTHRLACDRADVFAAAVSLAGSVDPAECHPSVPISVMEVHGTSDAIIKYDGGHTPLNPNDYPSVDTTLSTWATANGCTGVRTEKGTLDLVCDTAAPGSETKRESYDGCPAGVDVTLLKMNAVGHIPSFVMPAWPDAIWDFMSNHPRP